MSENPYAPPGSGLGAESRIDESGGGGDFDIGRCLSDAWANCWANFPLWLGVAIVASLVLLLSVVTVVGALLVAPVLAWGAVLFGLKMHDGGAEFGDLFSGFARYGKALVGMLVVIVVLLVISLIGQSVQIFGDLIDSDILSAVGSLINLAWAFLVTPRLAFSYFLVVDRDMAPMDAVRTSWEETAAAKWKVALLVLVGGLIFIAGLLLLLVGVIPAAVIVNLMWVSAYRQMLGAPSRS